MMGRKSERTWIVALVAAALVALVLWNFLGSGRVTGGSSLSAVQLSPAETSRFEQAVAQVSDRVLDQLTASGWRAVDIGSIVSAVESGLPVLAGFGFDGYFTDLEQRGLTGSAEGIAGRYEHKVSTPRWKQMAEEGLVPDPARQGLSLRDKARLLVETNHLFYQSRLVSIDPDSILVKEGHGLQLDTGERYTIATSLSNEWPAQSASPGVTVEFTGRLSTGQAVRVNFLMGKTSGQTPEVWGIAACAIIGTGQDKLMFAPF